MKNLVLFILFFLSLSISLGQQPLYESLDRNDVNLKTSTFGSLFHNRHMASPAYEVPMGSGNHVVFFSSLWFGGVDQDSNINVSATYNRTKPSFISGPISSTNDYNSNLYAKNYLDKSWKVSKDEIIYHIDNYDQPGYEAPEGIKNWPGNGIQQLGVANNLAPFIDVNNDGEYNPDDGDYPCIKGDEAVYTILNDDYASNTPINTDLIGMGLEVHIMLYQFENKPLVDQTTFVNVKVYNRGNKSYTNFKPTFYMDFDIGFAFDDYIGCDTSKNVGYGYNATNFDSGGSNADGYGENPPAMGVVCLNHKMERFGCYLNGSPVLPTSDPTNTAEYWNYMNGKWKDSTSWVVGGMGYPGTSGATSTPTNYLYPGNPLTGEGWSERNVDGNDSANPEDEDKRFLVVSENRNLNPGEMQEYDYAVLFKNEGNHLEDALNIVDLAADVEKLFQSEILNSSCEEEGTGQTDTFTPQPDSIVNNQMFEITRLDGEGNMGLSVELTPDTESNILDSNQVEKITYQRGKGPIMAYIYDTLNHESGHFQLEFNSYTSDIDSAHWTIYRYDTLSGNLLDSVNSTSTIKQGDTHFISQWGIAVKVKQEKYLCRTNWKLESQDSVNCQFHMQTARAISSSLTFQDENHKWLTGVEDNSSYSPSNWIIKPKSNIIPDDSLTNVEHPSCYNNFGYHCFYEHSNYINGIIAPASNVRRNNCGFMPLQDNSEYTPNNNGLLYNNLVFHPGIDIVFTSDKSKWTKCPVIEMNNDPSTSVGNALPGGLRQAPSIDKYGNMDNSGTMGMSWFPGYAIDVETGRRLNMAFGENSTLINDNGSDMIWNPTDRKYDLNGDPVLGGQHVIYVFGGQHEGMPNYDEGEFLHDKLSNITNPSNMKAVYRNISWVMQPLLEPNKTLLDNETRVSVRVSKEFNEYEITNLNNSKPMFEWNAVPYEDINPTNFIVTNDLHVFPNPANEMVKIAWDEEGVDIIQFANSNGQILKQIDVQNETKEVDVNVSTMNQGLYFVRVGSNMRRLLIIK